MNTRLSVGLVVGFGLLCGPVGAVAEEMTSHKDMAAAMAAYEAVMTPGPAHEGLQRFVGEWDVASKMWWDGPDGPAVQSTGRSTVVSILGGRFIEEAYTAEVPMPGPDGTIMMAPFEGRGIMGYDNFRKMYRSVWMDTWGTQLLVSNGVATPDGARITAIGEMDEPMLNVVGRPIKYVISIISDDEHLFEMYDLHAGDDYKVFEMRYTRAAAD